MLLQSAYGLLEWAFLLAYMCRTPYARSSRERDALQCRTPPLPPSPHARGKNAGDKRGRLGIITPLIRGRGEETDAGREDFGGRKEEEAVGATKTRFNIDF